MTYPGQSLVSEDGHQPTGLVPYEQTQMFCNHDCMLSLELDIEVSREAIPGSVRCSARGCVLYIKGVARSGGEVTPLDDNLFDDENPWPASPGEIAATSSAIANQEAKAKPKAFTKDEKIAFRKDWDDRVDRGLSGSSEV